MCLFVILVKHKDKSSCGGEVGVRNWQRLQAGKQDVKQALIKTYSSHGEGWPFADICCTAYSMQRGWCYHAKHKKRSPHPFNLYIFLLYQERSERLEWISPCAHFTASRELKYDFFFFFLKTAYMTVYMEQIYKSRHKTSPLVIV